MQGANDVTCLQRQDNLVAILLYSFAINIGDVSLNLPLLPTMLLMMDSILPDRVEDRVIQVRKIHHLQRVTNYCKIIFKHCQTNLLYNTNKNHLSTESLKACQSLLTEYLPQLKSLPKATITRQVCGGCLDFKVSITQPLEEHGAWAEKNYEPLESEFMEKLKGIEGTSLHEVQESECFVFFCDNGMFEKIFFGTM